MSYASFLIVTPEMLALSLVIVGLCERRTLDPEISGLLAHYEHKFKHHEDVLNFRRELFHILAELRYRNEVVIPWLIMITSLLASLIEGKHANRDAFLAGVAIGLIFLAVDFVVSRSVSGRGRAKVLHVMLISIFGLVSMGVKLDLLGSMAPGTSTS